MCSNEKIELFDEFYEWLKDDGLKPYKSERLHRKTIFSALINEDKMTIDNFNDFLEYKKINDLKSKHVICNNINSIIQNIIVHNHHLEIQTTDNSKIEVKKELLAEFVRQCIEN